MRLAGRRSPWMRCAPAALRAGAGAVCLWHGHAADDHLHAGVHGAGPATRRRRLLLTGELGRQLNACCAPQVPAHADGGLPAPVALPQRLLSACPRLALQFLEKVLHASPALAELRTVDEAIVIGAALSLSSSAFVLQLLRERGELDTKFGQATLGILLLQDIATVPFLVLLPLVEGNNSGEALQGQRRRRHVTLGCSVAVVGLAGARMCLTPAGGALSACLQRCWRAQTPFRCCSSWGPRRSRRWAAWALCCWAAASSCAGGTGIEQYSRQLAARAACSRQLAGWMDGRCQPRLLLGRAGCLSWWPRRGARRPSSRCAC